MALIDPFSKRLLAGAGQRGPISIMYHSISPGASTPGWQWAVSFQAFRDHLALLRDFGWHTINANALTNGINHLPTRTILLTFDDGYADNYIAAEELAKRKMSATWFIVTKDINQQSSWSDTDSPKLNLLTSRQLLDMHNAGMEIGSHTCSHCQLDAVDEQKLNNELSLSKACLSELLKKPVVSLAYPYGKYNDIVLSATQSAGYDIAFTTRTGSGLVGNDLLQVRRISIMADDTLSSFARKLAFADNDVTWKKMGRYALNRIKDRIGKT